MRVIHLHGKGDDFILYLQVDGGYHGPGTYDLRPWPTGSLGAGDSTAKVAVRQWSDGKLWQSLEGSLTIDRTEEAGSVNARLASQADTGSGLIPGSVLQISGPCMCP